MQRLIDGHRNRARELKDLALACGKRAAKGVVPDCKGRNGQKPLCFCDLRAIGRR